MTESVVEEAALHWLEQLGYAVLSGAAIAPDEPHAERAGFGDVVLVQRLRSALTRINPKLPADAIDDAVRQVTRTESPCLGENNHRFHRLVPNTGTAA
jgi:type I restriction enzyme R subunit